MNPLVSGIARTPNELQQCFELRYAANLRDGKRSRFLDHDRRVVRDELDDCATIHYVSSGERIVGTMRSVWGGHTIPDHYRAWYGLDALGGLAPEEIAFTSRLIIAPEFRKSPVLPMLLAAIYTDGRAKGVNVDFMHCSPELIGLYERIGFQCYRAGVIDTDVGCHVPMLLTADAHDWLAQIRSPFSLCTRGFTAKPERRGWFDARFPRHAAGVTPNRLGGDAFLQRLERHGLDALCAELSVDGERLRRCALFEAMAGDCIARSRDRFGSELIQLQGSSELRTADGGVLSRHAAGDCVDAFTREHDGAEIELVASSDSSFLCLALPRAELRSAAQRAA